MRSQKNKVPVTIQIGTVRKFKIGMLVKTTQPKPNPILDGAERIIQPSLFLKLSFLLSKAGSRKSKHIKIVDKIMPTILAITGATGAIAKLKQQIDSPPQDRQRITSEAITNIKAAVSNPTLLEKAKSLLWTLWAFAQGVAGFIKIALCNIAQTNPAPRPCNLAILIHNKVICSRCKLIERLPVSIGSQPN